VARLSALSYSSVRTYEECPLRWKFLYIDNLTEAPRGYFSFGRTVHSVLEELVRPLVVPLARSTPSGQTQRTLEEFVHHAHAPTGSPSLMSREELLAAYARLWVSEGYTSPEEEARYRLLGEELLTNYYQEFVAAPPRPVAVEEHLEARWEGTAVHGYVDRIDLTPNGGLEVLDYKTTRGLSWADAAGSDQLTFYQLLVEQNYPQPVESLALYDLRGHTALRVERRPAEQLKQLQGRVGEVADAIREDRFEPTPARHCQRCEFKDRCPEFRSVAGEERARMGELVDRFIRLRNEEARVDSELRRVAEELHREAERWNVHRISGREGTALRRREERLTLSPESAASFLHEEAVRAKAARLGPEELARLLKDPEVDPALRRRLRSSVGRSVKWFWELETEGEDPARRNG
jgi:RecB family exonuclease